MLQGYHSYLIRNKHFVVSGPIAIATAIGVLFATSAVTASYAEARSESNRISQEQNILRSIDSNNAITNNIINSNISIELGKSIDNLKFPTTLSAQTSNNYHNSQHLKHEVNFMFKKDKILSFHDLEMQRWYSTIKNIVYNNAKCITDSEIKEATRLIVGLSTLTTSIIHLQESSNQCKNSIMSKTLMVPKRSENGSSYTLFSEDSIISKSTTLFGHNIQIIGR